MVIVISANTMTAACSACPNGMTNNGLFDCGKASNKHFFETSEVSCGEAGKHAPNFECEWGRTSFSTVTSLQPFPRHIVFRNKSRSLLNNMNETSTNNFVSFIVHWSNWRQKDCLGHVSLFHWRIGLTFSWFFPVCRPGWFVDGDHTEDCQPCPVGFYKTNSPTDSYLEGKKVFTVCFQFWRGH